MKLFIARETHPGETRIPVIPPTVEKLVKLGAVVTIETGLGKTLGIPDDAFTKVGAVVAGDAASGAAGADIVLRLRKPPMESLASLKPGAVHVSYLDPFNEPELIKALAKQGVSAVSLEMIPRTTIAQKMDVLSSQANLGGYVAVILAAERINKIFPMMTTPAGTIAPARVFIIGVGVAGLQAIATAKRLGAIVEAFDTRAVVEEQVKSLGAKFVKIDLGETGQTKDGYAKALTEEQLKLQRAGMARHCASADVVITTAQVFGRKAPVIVTKDMVAGMAPGSVVVDMAVETGGNVEGSEAAQRVCNWTRWGTYLPERQWATVREDYSAEGDPWRGFTHEDARQRAYRWGEDGILGLCDRECRLCFAPALWNTRDPFLKERLFGLTGPEGNHGEDVKELYYYLDNTPTTSYARGLYKYPQSAFPYAALRARNARRETGTPEYELLDTGVFDGNCYFDLLVEYAKAAPDDVLIRLTVVNRGPEPAPLHLLPTLWFRNTWIWGCDHEGCTPKPRIERHDDRTLAAEHMTLGRFHFAADAAPDGSPPRFLFTENESNTQALWGVPGYTAYVKDAFHAAVVDGRSDAVNPHQVGTKAAVHYRLDLPPGGTAVLRLRLYAADAAPAEPLGGAFESIFTDRQAEAEAFHQKLEPPGLPEDARRVRRQALAGLLWSRQFYHYSVRDWLQGDPQVADPPAERQAGRNAGWKHFFARDLLSVPDKWEYPWFASWDLAFHALPLAGLDPDFAKQQLLLLLREWYLHPNGQLPAYEFAFDDVNPPVHAWACRRVYELDDSRDLDFLEQAFHKLLINFTWWVNRKDPDGRNLFTGGFLGLDNIGVFDRSKPWPGGGHLAQADGTAWMAFYCVSMLRIALELALQRPAYEGVASKFFEHFVAIADAINTLGGSGLWDEQDGFYYDRLVRPDGSSLALKIRSVVGLVPLFAASALHVSAIERLPRFRKRLTWFLEHRADLAGQIAWMLCPRGASDHRLLAIPSRERLTRLLGYLFEESEFLSPFGIRSLSRHHEQHPYVLHLDGQTTRVAYAPGESDSGLFGGNSNWRGPVWLPLNYLLIESLREYHHFFGDELTVAYPTGSEHRVTLAQAADDLSRRLTRLVLTDAAGRRPCHGTDAVYAREPAFRELLLFHEHFDPETGRGLGASHQTGWTALLALLLGDGGNR